jgi:branched-subunit amino acid transport protein AzlD
MTNSALYPIAVIAVTALVTWALRAFPFLVFGNRPLPEMVHYLGKVLPPAIMTVLVIYCLRETSFIQYPFGIPEIIASLLVIVLQMIRRNMYLSIVAGTVCYMILIRLF